MIKNLLLASFVKKDELDIAIENIVNTININSRDIFIFSNCNDKNEYILTYNMDPNYANIFFSSIWPNTISVHRKNQTNTIYSINAMNELIKEKCNGQLNKSYNIDWNQYKNCFLIIKNYKLKIIPIKRIKINQ